MIEVLGFPTLSRFDLADALIDSIDYPVEHLVVVNNSGKKKWKPKKMEITEREISLSPYFFNFLSYIFIFSSPCLPESYPAAPFSRK